MEDRTKLTPLLLDCKNPKFNPSAIQSYCITAAATVWMRFHWHNLLHASALGIDAPYHGDHKGFGSYAAKAFVLGTWKSRFLDSGSKHLAWSIGGWIWWVAWHFPSACVFSVSLGHWKMEKKASQTHLTALPAGSFVVHSCSQSKLSWMLTCMDSEVETTVLVYILYI